MTEVKYVTFIFAMAWCIIPAGLSSAAASRPELVINLGGRLVDHIAESKTANVQLEQQANYYTGLPPGPQGADEGGLQVIVYTPEQLGMKAADFYRHLLPGLKENNTMQPVDLGKQSVRGTSRFNPHYSTIMVEQGGYVIMLTAYDPKNKINLAGRAREIMSRLDKTADPFDSAFQARLRAMNEELRQMDLENMELQKQIKQLEESLVRPVSPPSGSVRADGYGEVDLGPARNVPAELDAAQKKKQLESLRSRQADLARRQSAAQSRINDYSTPAARAQLRQMATCPEKTWAEQKAEAARIVQHYSKTLRQAEENVVRAEREKTIAVAEISRDAVGKSDQLEAEKRGEARGTARIAPDAGGQNERLRQAADKRDAAVTERDGYRAALAEEQQRLRLIELAGEIRRQLPPP